MLPNDEGNAMKPDNRELPAIVDAARFTSKPIVEPPQVVQGVLHRGSKAVYGGPSKAFKTWTLVDLCVAVATGCEWLGLSTALGRVLYVNFELQDFAIHSRLQAIAGDRTCRIPRNLHLWNLRGHACPLSRLLPELKKQITGEGYTLIVPDPIYKTLNGRNESDAGDIGELCEEIEAVAVETGAAVAFGAHFAKGNASGKEHIDRVSGSGVWARDPDTIITATAHEQEGAFAVEMTLRNFSPPPPFVIRWRFPRMVRDAMLDPTRLRRSKSGRAADYSVASILQHLPAPMCASDWQEVCKKEDGISESTFYRLKKEALASGLIAKAGKTWKKSENDVKPGKREKAP